MGNYCRCSCSDRLPGWIHWRSCPVGIRSPYSYPRNNRLAHNRNTWSDLRCLDVEGTDGIGRKSEVGHSIYSSMWDEHWTIIATRLTSETAISSVAAVSSGVRIISVVVPSVVDVIPPIIIRVISSVCVGVVGIPVVVGVVATWTELCILDHRQMI